VASERDVENLMAIVYSRFGSIDVLINNAGIMPSGKDLEEQSLESFDLYTLQQDLDNQCF